MQNNMSISWVVSQIFQFYFYIVIVRVFLTWIPSINMEQQPFKFMANIVDPVLNAFRGIIPPIGGMLDISPIIALIVLQIISALIVGALYNLGL